MAKEIKLTKGYVALIDDLDFESLMQWKWAAHVDQWNVYARRGTKVDGRSTSVSMHRCILQAPKGVLVDHRDGNGLNNQRDNLRLCSHEENSRNSRPRPSMLGFRGVTFLRGHKTPWRASLKISGRIRYVGCFKTPEEAAKAYDLAALEFHGEFASLNFKLPTQRSDVTK